MLSYQANFSKAVCFSFSLFLFYSHFMQGKLDLLIPVQLINQRNWVGLIRGGMNIKRPDPPLECTHK